MSNPTDSIRQLKPDEAWKLINEGAYVLDVRSHSEVTEGMLPNAMHIPHEEIIEGKNLPDEKMKNKNFVLYCKKGGRAQLAAEALLVAGYVNLYNAGGYTDLIEDQQQNEN